MAHCAATTILERSGCRAPFNDMNENIDSDLVRDGGTSVGMDGGDIRTRLDACLLPGRLATDVTEWAKPTDPFPVWRLADQAA